MAPIWRSWIESELDRNVLSGSIVASLSYRFIVLPYQAGQTISALTPLFKENPQQADRGEVSDHRTGGIP
jgi:hypothetical protein